MKLQNILTAAAIIATAFLVCSSTPAFAQGTMVVNQSQFDAVNNGAWSVAWGSDASILFETNNVSTGVTGGPQMIAGGASYTSDVWTLNLTFNDGNVVITANSAQVPSLFWTMSSSFSSVISVSNLLLGVVYKADNNESMTISDILVNGVSVSGTTFADASQTFGGLEVNSISPITSIQYDLGISTPGTWERQSPGGPPFGPALLDTLIVPGVQSVPEPSIFSLCGFGVTLFGIVKLKAKKK